MLFLLFCAALLLISPTSATPTRNSIAAKLILQFHYNSSRTPLPTNTSKVLYGEFSRPAPVYPFQGNVVQVEPYRACQMGTMGLDHTLRGNVALILLDQVKTFISGCVSYHNQARFAAQSGAAAIIIGPIDVDLHHSSSSPSPPSIPLVVIDHVEAGRLKTFMQAARNQNLITSISLAPTPMKNATVMQATITYTYVPTVLEGLLLLALVLLIVFILFVTIIKIRWRRHRLSSVTHDPCVRLLAKAALQSMEVRRFDGKRSTSKTTPAHPRSIISFFSSTAPSKQNTRDQYAAPSRVYSSRQSVVSGTTSGGEACAICIEDYTKGDQLRVLLCGHEFHQRCIDPWLIEERTCPLCQYDMVYHQYPAQSTSPKKTTPPTIDSVPIASTTQNTTTVPSTLVASTTKNTRRPQPTTNHKHHKRRAPRTQNTEEEDGYASDVSESAYSAVNVDTGERTRIRTVFVPARPLPWHLV